MDRDITDQQEREERLRRQNERLDRFTSVVSHDLRNPLLVAGGRLELLKEDCDSEHIEDIEHALNRMDALIEDLLTLAQDENTAMEREAVELKTLVQTCWETVATQNASLEIETDRTVHADRNQLQQVFENLIRNAVDRGGSDVTITVGDLDDGFYIADDGEGIPEDNLESIFDAGYSTATDGTGFGLSIVEQIVETHGWQIAVKESQAGGARFEISDVAQ